MTPLLHVPSALLTQLQNVGVNPVDLVLYITSRCNLRCAHCYVGTPLLDTGSTYEAGSLISFVKSIPKIDRVTVLGGEPLLYRPLTDLIAALDRECVAERRLTTNLTIAPSQALGRLLAARFRLCVSVDGHCAEVHERIRGSGTFDRTTKNIRRVVDAGHDVEVTHTVTSISAPFLLDSLELLRKLGIRRINLHKISPRGNAIENPSLDVGPTEWRALISQLERHAVDISHNDAILVRYELLYCTNDEYEALIRSGLYAPHAAGSFYSADGGHRIVLYPDGTVYISSEAFGTESYLGYISNGSFSYNIGAMNELELYRRHRTEFRVQMINPRLQGDESFPNVLCVSFRRQLYV